LLALNKDLAKKLIHSIKGKEFTLIYYLRWIVIKGFLLFLSLNPLYLLLLYYFLLVVFLFLLALLAMDFSWIIDFILALSP